MAHDDAEEGAPKRALPEPGRSATDWHSSGTPGPPRFASSPVPAPMATRSAGLNHTNGDRPGRRAAAPRRLVSPWTFPASLGWAVVSTIVPGAGLLKTRWRWLGAAFLLITTVIVVAGIGLVVVLPHASLGLALSPGVLDAAWIGLVLFGLVWVGTIVLTHLSLRPHPTAGWQRIVGSVVVGALALVIAVPTFVGARTVRTTASLISEVFDTRTDTGDPGNTNFGNAADPWANKERLNVLILGGDSGQARSAELGARTDTVIVASIDTATGETILFSLPRQTQRMPFKPGSALDKRWPNGFTNGVPNDAEFFLNAIYQNVPALAPDALPAGVDDPAAEVLKQSVGTALGLDIDYYVMVNMDGFIEFIDALGGITVHINKPVPVGGRTDTHTPPDRWLLPGPDQHLNGTDALWFARGRYGAAGGDYERMARQRCVIQAVADQADPATVLANYEALAEAGKEIITTDVPNRALPAMLTLALRVKDQPMRSLSFENGKNGFSTVYPDWELIQEQVTEMIEPPVIIETPEPSPAPGESGTPTPSPSAEPQTVVDACAYNPEAAA